MEALNGEIFSTTVTTLTEIVVCRVHIDQMKQIIVSNPSISLNLVAFLNLELARAGNTLRNLGFMSARERIACFILSLGDNRRPDKGVRVPLSHKDIARMLGLRAEIFSRGLSDIKRMGLVHELNRRFYLPDLYSTVRGVGVASQFM